MMHLQLRTELDLETYLEPSLVACCDGSIHARNRAAHLALSPQTSISSLFDICSGRAEALRTYLIRCSGSRQPLIEKVSFNGEGGAFDYRCFGNALVPRRKSRPASLLLRLLPVRDARFAARAECMKRLRTERHWRLAMEQSAELRSDRLRLVEQYCFVAEALRVAEAQNRRLQDEIKHIRTDERERIAQDLHDHAGQEMALVLVELRRMRDAAHGPARARLNDLAVHVSEVGRKIHHAVVGGRPRIVEELGLSRAIEITAVWFTTDGRLDLSFKKKGVESDALPAALESALYRVAQEALTNALRHALGAQKIDIVLEFNCQSVSLTIADDGVGLSTEAQQQGELGSSGIGLRGMQQRMNGIGGTLQIGPRFGKGTIVTAVAPLRPEPQQSAPP
ncbi:Histidine kinase [Bosea sp. OK403]|uniref:sensor histidine kinase n=1 Tax=Bosea sp. OK403 TaxID=1855286 RepID=UPI0008E4BA1A|nr:ATP-binding protein [Bosea sp. OK403]SFI03798.1 Histidine kinase [Bosea sp. OK403]